MTQSTWSFENPTRLHFGEGARGRLAPMMAGRRVLIVTTSRGRKQFQSDPLLALALHADVAWVDTVQPNPGLTDLQVELDRFRGQTFELVVAFGGGSALDAGKAMSVGLAKTVHSHNLRVLIEEPKLWLDLSPIPLVALPTTSGTGSEVTPFATVWDHEAKRKMSLAGPAVAPHTAIVDPELTHRLPFDATASTGLDALNQAFESTWNRNASPITLSMAGRAIGQALKALPRLNADLQDSEARSMIAEASVLAGMCISQTRTAICHSMSYPITAHFGVSHGYACAFTMSAAAERAFDFAPERFDALARVAGLDGRNELLSEVRGLISTFSVADIVRQAVPNLDALTSLTPEMVTPGRADNFIVPTGNGDLVDILRASYEG